MRVLIILLALLLPLQLSWAAVASYCQAQDDRVSTHLGHHEHSTTSADTQFGTQSGTQHSSPAENDAGCSLCHFSCMKSMQTCNTEVVASPAARLQLHAGYARHTTCHIADGPDKPNWVLAA